MRRRKVKDVEDKLKHYPDLVGFTPKSKKGKWQTSLGRPGPIHLEIGTGKGQFIHACATANPKTTFIGIEKQQSVLFRAVQKCLDEPLDNIFLLSMDAMDLRNVFSRNEIATIYLNFSDPWPKNRHEKRRLTHPQFLSSYQHILKPGGQLILKTDQASLFAYSLITLSAAGFLFDSVSLNWHSDDAFDGFMTEYEQKFSDQGPIFRLIAINGRVKK